MKRETAAAGAFLAICLLGVFLGPWHGFRLGVEGDWLRLFHADGTLVPSTAERAESERLRADSERLRADAAEAELARLRARLGADRQE